MAKLASSSNINSHFYPTSCSLQDQMTKQVVAEVKLLHHQLGHTSYDHTLQHLAFCQDVTLPSPVCHVCPLAKHSRLPHPFSKIHTTHCFELLHIDIWGLYKIPSLIGAHFFLLWLMILAMPLGHFFSIINLMLFMYSLSSLK